MGRVVSMEKHEFRDMLDRLHGELERTETVDDDSGKLLRSIMEDIQHVLQESDGLQLENHHTLKERLKDAIYHLEVSHPMLVGSMRQVSNTLSNMGI